MPCEDYTEVLQFGLVVYIFQQRIFMRAFITGLRRKVCTVCTNLHEGAIDTSSDSLEAWEFKHKVP